MALEIIIEVKKAEDEANSIISTAQIKSKEIVTKAYQEADKEYRRIVDEAKVKAQSIMDEAIALGNKEAKSIINKGDEEVYKFSSLPKENINNAIKLVVERIVNINGNS